MTNQLQCVNRLKPDFSDRVLTLNLILRAEDGVSIRSCEIVGSRFRNRTSFSDVNDISDVLHDRIARTIRSCLARVPQGAHVMSLPDFLVEIPGLALAGVHIMIMEVKDGLRNAILRFKEFIGSVNQLFKPDVGVEEPSSSYSERLAVNILGDICLPLLNIARALEALHAQTGTSVTALEDRTREFEFQTELLKRFVYNCGEQEKEKSEVLHDTGRLRRLTR